MTEESRAAEPQESGIEALARTIAVGALAGFLAGAVAGGIGSRVAMRITAEVAEGRFQGTLTDFEARVGEITAGGTFFLILMGGFIGVFGGLLYVALRRWVADCGPCRGPAFGLILLVIFGSAIIRSDNPDFHLFGPPTLNIAMFASIFILFGLLVAPLLDLVERMLARPTTHRPRRLTQAAYLFAPLLLLPAIGGIGIVAGRAVALFLPYILVGMPITTVLVGWSAGRFDRLSDLRGRWLAMAAALAVLALPLAVGLFLDVQAVAGIFEADT
ncbi:MAG: hypothetical protein HYS09_00180 [Chloroflexi bacterium]|nr:hypothetical protein [Chloroflexota bacterium]